MRVVWSLLVLLVFAPIDQGLARDFKISHQWPAETDARDLEITSKGLEDAFLSLTHEEK